jgi:Flp pilus assembly protein TadG
MHAKRHTRRPGRRGVTMVEGALVLNVFLLLLLGVFEFGRLMMVRHLVNDAVRGAARQASAGTDSKSAADIRNTALRLLVDQQFAQPPVIQVYRADANGNNIGAWDDAAFGQGIAVQIDVDYRPMLPSLGIVPSTVHFRARSIMRSEGD